MNDLVFMHGLNEEPYTTDKIIAECSKNQLKVVKNLIRNHKKDFEDFGVLHFENAKPLKGSKDGRPQKTYHLNEQQATLLITYLDNTPEVNKFKKSLVHEFYRMKQELTQRQIKKQRHVKTALDGLTIKEQERYKQLENIAISLVGLNKTWDEVKGVLLLA